VCLVDRPSLFFDAVSQVSGNETAMFMPEKGDTLLPKRKENSMHFPYDKDIAKCIAICSFLHAQKTIDN